MATKIKVFQQLSSIYHKE